MSPQEERLVLELHSKWGNRWSRIARKLPGRTDNEIKNYWRTHMRKKAQDRKKKNISNSSSSSLSNSSSTSSSELNNPTAAENRKRNFYDTGGVTDPSTELGQKGNKIEESNKIYTFDEIWNEIELSEDIDYMKPTGESYFSGQMMASPVWSVSLWTAEEEEEEERWTFTPKTNCISDSQFYSFYN